MIENPVFYAEHDTHMELFQTLLSAAHDSGYSLRIVRSDFTKNTMVIGCARGGEYKSTASSRKTRTKKTNCPLLIRCRNVCEKWR